MKPLNKKPELIAKENTKTNAKNIPLMQRSILSLCIGSALVLPALSGNAVADNYLANTNTENTNVSSTIANKKSYNITAGALGDALNLFAEQSGIALTYNTDYVTGLSTKGLQGNYSINQALAILLNDSHLAVKKTRFGYTIEKTAQENSNIAGTLALTTVASESRFGDAPQEQGGFKAEYQSTSSKMAMKIIDTPQAISAVTRAALDARLVKSLATAVELTPSLSSIAVGVAGGTPDMFGGYGKVSNVFSIRGQVADIRIDGFKTASYYGDDDGIDMAAFERIEVIRGPAGFYGSGSLGGFINKVRKKPQAEFGGELSLQAGSYDTYRAEGGITGSMNQDETLRGRVDFAYDNAGAFTDDIGNERLFIAPSIEAIISDNTRILMQLSYQKDKYDANQGMPIQKIDNQVTLYEQFSSNTKLYGAIGDKSLKESYTASLTVNHELSDRWLASLYLQGQKKSTNFVNGNYASIYNGNVYANHLTDYRDGDSWAGELRLQGSFDAFEREHKVLLGVESNKLNLTRLRGNGYNYISSLENYDGDIGNYPAISADEIGTPWEDNTISTNYAIYGQILFSVFDNTKLLVATRYDAAKTGVSANYDIYYGETKDNAWSSRLGLIQTINESINVYVSYGQSFAPILPYSISRSGPLEPETGEAYEIGIKTEWFNNKLAVNLSAYQQELDNRVLDDTTNGRDDSFVIASDLHVTKGLELELNGSFYPGWVIGGSASLMDNEFVGEEDPFKGLSFEGTFDKQASIYSSYQVQQGSLRGLELGATFVHMGTINYLDWNSTPNKQFYLESYNRFDLNISYQGMAHWDINLLVRNVTDEKYLSAVYNKTAYWGAPRSVLLQATYHFD